MTSVEEIERAIEQLPPSELARFRAWFEAFDAARFDTAIARGASSGELDKLANDALADHRAGRSHEL